MNQFQIKLLALCTGLGYIFYFGEAFIRDIFPVGELPLSTLCLILGAYIFCFVINLYISSKMQPKHLLLIIGIICSVCFLIAYQQFRARGEDVPFTMLYASLSAVGGVILCGIACHICENIKRNF